MEDPMNPRALIAASLFATTALADSGGLNIVLNQPPTGPVLEALSVYGTVLDIVPEINAVTLRAREDQLPGILALPCVAAAGPDGVCTTAGQVFPRLDAQVDLWNLDAINVTDFGAGRTVGYDGSGVYIAVIGTGLPNNWRDYFPEERIATSLARGLSGGGGTKGNVTSQPDFWENDTNEHELGVTSIILGFRYLAEVPALPVQFPGVAPGATVIPIKCSNNNGDGWYQDSTLARAIVYVTNLKVSGPLTGSPVVINASWGNGGAADPIIQAAVDYAINHGVIFVAAAGNEADRGMRHPGRYAPVISVAATGNVREFPPDDPTFYTWFTRDMPENDPAEHFIAPFSAWELPGQDLDVAAPGFMMPVPYTVGARPDYSYFAGTSAATPHVAGVVALMLQKKPESDGGAGGVHPRIDRDAPAAGVPLGTVHRLHPRHVPAPEQRLPQRRVLPDQRMLGRQRRQSWVGPGRCGTGGRALRDVALLTVSCRTPDKRPSPPAGRIRNSGSTRGRTASTTATTPPSRRQAAPAPRTAGIPPSRSPVARRSAAPAATSASCPSGRRAAPGGNPGARPTKWPCARSGPR
jgi:subtilisin family serine protease